MYKYGKNGTSMLERKDEGKKARNLSNVDPFFYRNKQGRVSHLRNLFHFKLNDHQGTLKIVKHF